MQTSPNIGENADINDYDVIKIVCAIANRHLGFYFSHVQRPFRQISRIGFAIASLPSCSVQNIYASSVGEKRLDRAWEAYKDCCLSEMHHRVRILRHLAVYSQHVGLLVHVIHLFLFRGVIGVTSNLMYHVMQFRDNLGIWIQTCECN